MTTSQAIGTTAAYQPLPAQRDGLFIVLEGISGSGKSTLAGLLASRLQGRYFHPVPAPVSNLQPYNDTAAADIDPFTSYLTSPDVTIYLHTSTTKLTRRMRTKADQTRSDHDLLDDPALLQRLQDRYDQIAATDPTARHLSTTGRSPAELAGLITAILPAVPVHVPA